MTISTVQQRRQGIPASPSKIFVEQAYGSSRFPSESNDPDKPVSAISACHISILVGILGLGMHLYGFPLLFICFWHTEAIISGFSEIFEDDIPPFIRVLHRGLLFAPIIIALIDNPRDDGIERRLIDDILTKYRFHRLVQLNRIIDRIRTPRRDRCVVVAFTRLWVSAIRAICMVGRYEIHNEAYRHRGREDASKILTSEDLTDLRQATLEYIRSADSYCEAVELYREAVDHFRMPANKRSAPNVNRFCDDLHFQLEALVEHVEGLRDRFSKMSVWKRAWCRPLVVDFNEGLKPLPMDIILEERDGSNQK